MDNDISQSEISMLLDVFMYTDYEYAKDGDTLKNIVENMPKYFDVTQKHKNEYAILSDAIKDPRVGELKINYIAQSLGYNEGTNAVTFTSDDKKVYIIYRGTADGEWYDNGQGMTASETKQQKEALRYFDDVIDRLNIDESYEVYVSGHSKGGNKVQYITMESKNEKYITKTFSVDGQGQSKNAIKKWKNEYSKEEYDRRISKIYGINGENDFVSVLGNGIILSQNISYIKTPVGTFDDSSITNIAGYHDITYMFAKEGTDFLGNKKLTFTGRKNDYAVNIGDFSIWTKNLYSSINKMPEGIIDDNAKTLMQLIEIANKGKMAGVDGQMATYGELKGFIYTGLPMILMSAFAKKDGRKLINDIFHNKSMIRNINDAKDIEINYIHLNNLSIELKNISDRLNEILTQMEITGLGLPLYFDGDIYRKPHFDNSMVKLKGMKSKLRHMSNALLRVALLYSECDKKLEVM